MHGGSEGIALRCDLQGRVLEAFFCGVMEEAADALPGRPLTSLVEPEDMGRLLRFLLKIRSEGVAFCQDIRLSTRQGCPSVTFGGVSFDRALLVMAFPEPGNARSSEKGGPPGDTPEDMAPLSLYDELARLTNELFNLQRDLAGKNAALTRANQQISELMRTDPLTGLSTRRYFQERLSQTISLAQRHATPLSLALCDLDHFKKINDTFGHQAGDRVLKAFGEILRTTCRKEDIAGRLGGEEFAFCLPNTESAGALAIAERVRTTLLEKDILENAYRVTVSTGVAELQVGETSERLMQRADEAMYRAKALGRNRTLVGSPVKEEAVYERTP